MCLHASENQNRVALTAEPDAPRRRIFFGQYLADLDGRMVTGPHGVLDMAKSEFDVLEVFLKRANRMLTRATISEAIGLTEDPENSRAVDIRIMRLQKEDRGRPGQSEDSCAPYAAKAISSRCPARTAPSAELFRAGV